MLVFYLAAIDSDESKNKFEYIYRKYYRFMLRTASSIIRDSSLAEDAVHETFVQLLKEIDSLRIDNEKSLQSYLYILTRERTIDFLRKWERRRGVLTDYENRSTSFDNFKEPEEIALTNLQLNKAVSILSDMPSIYRRTLVLRVKGYSIREIAQITNSSETSVYKGYKQDKIEMRGDRAEMSDFPLYLNTVAGGLDRRDQTIGGFSFVVKIYAVPVVEIIG